MKRQLECPTTVTRWYLKFQVPSISGFRVAALAENQFLDILNEKCTCKKNLPHIYIYMIHMYIIYDLYYMMHIYMIYMYVNYMFMYIFSEWLDKDRGRPEFTPTSLLYVLYDFTFWCEVFLLLVPPPHAPLG